MPDLLYEKHQDEHYAVFTMNRPDRLNAMGGTMNEDFAIALHDFNNDRDMWVGIVTGNGRAFSAGADLRQMAERNTQVAEINEKFEKGEIDQDQRARELFRVSGGQQGGPIGSLFQLSRSRKPFIAAINGLAGDRLRYPNHFNRSLHGPVRGQARHHAGLRSAHHAANRTVRRSALHRSDRRSHHSRAVLAYRACP